MGRKAFGRRRSWWVHRCQSSRKLSGKCDSTAEETLGPPSSFQERFLPRTPFRLPYPGLCCCAKSYLLAFMRNQDPQNQPIGNPDLKAKPSSVKLESPPSFSPIASPSSFSLTYRSKCSLKKCFPLGLEIGNSQHLRRT